MGGLNMQSMSSKRGAKEHGDPEVGAHPGPTSPLLVHHGSAQSEGVKQPTTSDHDSVIMTPPRVVAFATS